MSVSYIVPVWREDAYARTALPWLKQQVDWYGAQLIEVRGERSIFKSLEKGRRQAVHRYVVYVHDDVRLIRPADLTVQLCTAFERLPKLGLLGAVGKVNRSHVPWWRNAGPYVGHYCRRGPHGQLVYTYADAKGHSQYRDVRGEPAEDVREPRWNRFAKAGLVDGFFMAEDRERMGQPWDVETYGPNWHGYDMDRCFQAHSLGLDVMVSHWLFLHDNAGHAGYKGTSKKQAIGKDRENRLVKSAGDKLWLADLEKVNRMLREKWGVG